MPDRESIGLRAVSQVRRVGVAIALLTAVSGPGFAVAQSGQMWAMAETYKRNQEELRSYRWKSRTEVTVGGKVKELTLFRVRYDLDGKLHKTPIGTDEPEPKVRGPIRRRRAKKKLKKAGEFNQDLRELIRSYTQFTPRQMHSVFARAGEWRGQGVTEGVTRVQARGVVRPGDTMDIWVDSRTRRLRRVEIRTSLDGEFVTVVTEFHLLEDGPTYPAQTLVKTETRGKPLIIQTDNFDYLRQSP